MADSVAQVFKDIPGRFDADAWGSEDAVLVFDVTGAGGGQWTAKIAGGELDITDGISDEYDMKMTTAAEDLLAMVNGELNAVSAFMQGKVKVDGNMSLAMKLQGLIGA